MSNYLTVDEATVLAACMRGEVVNARRNHSIEPSKRRTVMNRDGNRCVRCGATNDLTINHGFLAAEAGRTAMKTCRHSAGPATRQRRTSGR